MPPTLRDELLRTFELASLRSKFRNVRTSRQTNLADQLRERCDTARAKILEGYGRQFETRVEIARRRIIDKAGSRVRTLRPNGVGRDRFSPSDTLRLAQGEVRNERQSRVNRIDEFERRELHRLFEQYERENEQHGRARDAFQRAGQVYPTEQLSCVRTGPE